MILACDNCIQGDASGWYLPLALLVAACLGLAAGCVFLARRRTGARALATTAAAVALVVGPVGAVFAIATDATFEGVICGSALSASLERPRPGMTLDRWQEGCRLHGEAVIRGATAWGVASAGAAALLVLGSSLPPRRRAAFA